MSLKLRWVMISLKRYYVSLALAAALFTLGFTYNFVYENERRPRLFTTAVTRTSTSSRNNDLIVEGNIFSNSELRAKLYKQKVERLSKKMKKSRLIELNAKRVARPNYNVHIFYYAWYGNPRYDGSYRHWNHRYVPNWKTDDRKVYPTGSHDAPTDLASNFYPKLGCYSSRDPAVIETHFRQIRDAGVGVVVLSWSPPTFKDSPSDLMPRLFETAESVGLKIALHIEAYAKRDPVNLLEHLKQFMGEFGSHAALYKMRKALGGKKEVPVFYVYDSYLTPSVAWKEVLSRKGNLSVRDTDLDAIFLGLVVDLSHRSHVRKSQFDGFYTYFASNSFTYGSTWKNWRALSKFAVQFGLIFVPSVGPGYADTQIRPWNSANTRHRRHGQYYDVAWRSAISNDNVNYVSITSFNEWHEGTQIEPARSKNILGFTYLDYEPDGADFYLNLTQWWVGQFGKSLESNEMDQHLFNN
ncbi:PREDICTED: glycoprotein endo-alpha-1,2-mannosidase [Nicrophorus vespilloides]|uniref:Glycoprotein endo-alpha-1,2-mannosidase n=1 Tax=Nicrophorus vespilloides TaxID=110193 RepID=A0ABM1MA46_NICVS|nr:PREDICTED: glycoprotein endo-alpha-1,2-mannosidase [Nicrophorus vespilloides]